MNNNINNGNMKMQVFNSEEFGQVRTIYEGDKVLFCGTDVARALGYNEPHKAVSRHCRYGMKRAIPHPQSSDKMLDMSFIPEGDVYRLIIRSKLPGAEKFERWVFDEVLPTIHKTGEYSMVRKPDSYMISDPVERAKRWIEEEQERQRLASTIEDQKPLVEFADKVSNTKDCIDMGQMAKLLKDEHINIGRNRLFSWLRDNGYLMKNNIPYQKHIESGLFVVKEIVKDTIYGDKVFTTTYVTGKGQIHIAAKVKEKFGVSKVKS